MKNNKIILLSLFALLATSAVACKPKEINDGVTKADSVSKIVGKLFAPGEKKEDNFAHKEENGKFTTVNLYQINGVKDIFYADIAEYIDSMYMPKNVFEEDGIKAQNGTVFTLGKDETETKIDVAKGTIHFANYSAFASCGFINQLTQFTSQFVMDFEKVGKGDYSYTINLADYGIKAYKDPKVIGKYYLPYQTLFDTIWFSNNNFHVVDDRGIFFGADRENFYKKEDNVITPEDYGTFYYSNTKESWSQEFADFQYNEFCLQMDIGYGLRYKYMNNMKADDFIKTTPFYNDLHSTNPTTFDTALGNFLLQKLDDVHTVYQMPSPATGMKVIPITAGDRRNVVMNAENTLIALRETAISDADWVYKEVGDTAFLYMDEISMFTWGEAKMYDGIIRREDSPIKNVVLDLSACPGGTVVDGLSIASWLSGSVTSKTRDAITGDYNISKGSYDLDRNDIIDDNDSLINYNVYCMISGGSFSCANLIPSMVKENGNVKLIGQTSGGGSCSIMMTSCAGGSMYYISSRSESCKGEEGNLVTVDDGVEPDIPLTEFSQFVDYNYISNLIHEDLAK